MKLKITLLVLITTVSTAFAPLMFDFTSWDDLTKASPDIVIARCIATTPDKIPDAHGFISRGLNLISSDIEVVSVLKGDTKAGAARMLSEYWPRQGECFLMFATYQSNNVSQSYDSVESYRIVPLGHYFTTNDLTGKALDEQIQMALRRRLDYVKYELGKDTEEKNRLESGLKK